MATKKVELDDGRGGVSPPAESKPDLYSGQGGSYRITETGERVRLEWTDPEPQTKTPSED